MKTISVILVTYNSKAYIEPCLGSILSQGFKDYEVIIIDNASRDETKSIINARYPEIILIENSQNLGTCRARNQGIAKASGRFILCLDHDVKLYPDFLENIFHEIEGKDTIGAVQPKILRVDGKTIYSTGIYPSWLRRFYDIGEGQNNGTRFNQRRYIFGASAATAIYRREALETIGQSGEYFDEDFFYFFEDVDVSWRMQKKGWRVLYAADAECIHAGGRSRNKDSISQYLCMRNRYLLIIKNASWVELLRIPIVFLIYDLWRDLFMLVINPKYFLKALFEIFKLYPKMVRKRYN